MKIVEVVRPVVQMVPVRSLPNGAVGVCSNGLVHERSDELDICIPSEIVRYHGRLCRCHSDVEPLPPGTKITYEV